MAGRSIAALLLVGLLAGLFVRGSSGAAPFSLEEVTTPDLAPEVLLAALPPTFADFPLQTPDPQPAAPSFATSRETRLYVDPNDPAVIAVIVTIDTLAEGVGAAGALATLSDENAIAKPSWEVEEQDLSPEAVVPYLLATEQNVDGSVFASVSWGHRVGRHVFTVAARTAEEREAFVLALLDQLGRSDEEASPGATATADAETGDSVAERETAVAQTAEDQAAQAEALDATAAALATEEADLAEREAALSETAAAIEADAEAVAAEATALAATREAPGPAATIEALEAQATEQDAALATAEADLNAAEEQNATLEAGADAPAGATPVRPTAGTPSAIRTVPVEVVITIDGVGLTQGNAADEADTIEALDEALTPFADAGCRIGFVITEASATQVVQGNEIADAVNDLIAAEFPDLAAGAGYYGFAEVPGEPGQVVLLIYTDEACPVT
jgi:hypothetical protein